MRGWAWSVVGVFVGTVSAVGLVGCSSSAAAPASAPADPPASLAPAVAPVAPAPVATSGPVSEGLVAIDGIAAQIAAAGSDTGKAKPLADQIEPRWSKIEDTVRANSKDAYVALEDAFAVLEDASRSGDAAAAAKGARSVSDAVRTYVARYQG